MKLQFNKTITIHEVVKKTKAHLFKDLSRGDVLELTVDICHLGTSRGRSYSPDLHVYSPRNGDSARKSFNEFANIMRNFSVS